MRPSPKGQPGLCVVHRDLRETSTPRHHQQTPPSHVNTRQTRLNGSPCRWHHVTRFISSRSNALPCDDEASDDEFRRNGSDHFFIPMGFALKPAAQVSMSPAYDRRGEERHAVFRVTVVGSVLLEASWNKEKQPGSKLLLTDFMDF